MSQPASSPVSVVIPAYNEADRIAATIRAGLSLPGVREVLVVDDGSKDETARVARSAGARVVSLVRNGGKARAMTEGANAATGNLLLFLDADLGETAKEASVLVTPVFRDEAEMTIATFPVHPGKGGGWGWVVRLSRAGIARATGRTMIAPLSGQRCLTRRAWSVAQPLASGFGVETGLTIDVLQAGLRVQEVPTQMDHRVTGRGWRARLHRARQGRDVLRALVPRLLFPKKPGIFSS